MLCDKPAASVSVSHHSLGIGVEGRQIQPHGLVCSLLLVPLFFSLSGCKTDLQETNIFLVSVHLFLLFLVKLV
jgi:hypothetical protein